jgi:MFS family permease
MRDSQETNQPTRETFFYGYIVVIAAFSIMVVSWAIYNSFGVFFTPLLNEFGWERATTSGAFSLSMFIYGVLGVVVGALNDRFGPRVVLTLCGLLLGLGYLLMSQLSALWQLYLFLGVIVGVAMSGVWVPQLSTVARWFVKRRTLMSGIVLAGSGIGQLLGPIITSRLIVNYGWSKSYIIVGIAVMLCIVLGAQFLRRDPEQMRLRPYGETDKKLRQSKLVADGFTFGKAVRTAQFWIAFSILACFGYGSFSVILHIVPYAIDLKTLPVSAANVLATRGALGILGSNVLGAFADRLGNRRIFIIGLIMMSAALLGLSIVDREWMLYPLVVMIGFAGGGMGASESPITAWLFGLRSHGLIYGVVHVGFTVGAAVGPYLTGYIFDLTGSYRVAFLVCGIVGLIGLVLTIILRQPKSQPFKSDANSF